MNLYTYMAHNVAKILKKRPNDILDHWGVAELIVCFGQYANENSYKNFLEIEEHNKTAKKKIPKPTPYAVKFITYDDIDYEEE